MRRVPETALGKTDVWALSRGGRAEPKVLIRTSWKGRREAGKVECLRSKRRAR